MSRKHFYDPITEFIFLQDEPQQADMIFVPGGHYPDSAVHAAELYLAGYASYIMPSGRWSIVDGKFDSDVYETEWEYLRDILLGKGVPPEAVLREDQATYTYQNAICSRQVVEELNIIVKRAILVCQAFHARRSLLYYQEQFPDVDFLICPVVTRGISRDNWYQSDHGIDTVLGEMERCGSQFHEIMRLYKND